MPPLDQPQRCVHRIDIAQEIFERNTQSALPHGMVGELRLESQLLIGGAGQDRREQIKHELPSITSGGHGRRQRRAQHVHRRRGQEIVERAQRVREPRQ